MIIAYPALRVSTESELCWYLCQAFDLNDFNLILLDRLLESAPRNMISFSHRDLYHPCVVFSYPSLHLTYDVTPANLAITVAYQHLLLRPCHSRECSATHCLLLDWWFHQMVLALLALWATLACGMAHTEVCELYDFLLYDRWKHGVVR